MTTTFALAMSTVDRGPVNYLGQTLASLGRGGVFASPLNAGVVVADGGSTDATSLTRARGTWPVTSLYGRQGQSAPTTAIQALESAIGHEAEWIIWLEDDVLVCGAFLESVDGWLTDHATPDYRLYALYCPYPEVRRAWQAHATSWRYPLAAFYGSQALVLRREDVRSLITYFWASPWREAPSSQGFDLCLRDWHRQVYPGLDAMLATVPCLVNHVGHVSALGHDAVFHTAPAWGGEDWSYQRLPC